MKISKSIEEAVLKAYLGMWETYFNGDYDRFESLIDDDFKLIGTSESEICNSKAEGLEYFKALTGELLGKTEFRNRSMEVTSYDPLMLVTEMADIYALIEGEMQFYSKFRASTFLRKKGDGWKVIQQHGSLPDMRVQDGETLAIDKISQENLELRDAIKRRTAELEVKNRELVIEAALERVRSKAMAMLKSEDLGNAVAIVFDELDKLDMGALRCGISIINKEKRTTNVWSTVKSGNSTGVQVSGDESMDIHPLLQGAYKAWLEQEDYSYVLESQDLHSFYTALAFTNFKLPGTGQEPGKTDSSKEFMYVAHFPAGGLYAFRQAAFNNESKHVIRRFAEVFNLTYTRFNDLKIAEAQAEQAGLDLIHLKEEKKRTELALAELKETQKQLIQSEKMASLGELTAGIAHEIQNPLNFVNNFSEINTELIEELKSEKSKEKGERDEQLEEDLLSDIAENEKKINHHGKRADAIVKGMLQHSRSSSSVKEPTDINKLVDEYLRLAYHGLRAKDKSFNATLETDYDAAIGNVSIVPQDIGRAVLNLINNAFYAASLAFPSSAEGIADPEKKAGPTVCVSTKKTDDKVLISVRDNGPGIPQKIVGKIFQPFFTTKPTGQGTGLGLSLAYDIVKAHGGELKVETKEGDTSSNDMIEHGTTFIIQLPVNA